MLPTKFQTNLPFGSGEEDFQDVDHDSQLGFLTRTIIAIFDLHVSPMLPTKFKVNQPFGSGEDAKNTFFKMSAMTPILDFRSEWF